MKNLTVRQWIGLGLSILGTIFGIIFLKGLFDSTNTDFWAGPAFLCAVAAYFLCGGIGYAVKTAWGIAKALWFLVPVFPADVVLGLAGFLLGFFMLFFVPVFFVIRSLRDNASQA